MVQTHEPIKSIADIQPGDHLCCIYDTEDEHRAVLTPFLRQGLEQNQKVFYIVDARTRDTVIDYLKKDGVDVGQYLKTGQFSILTVSDVYMKGGVFDPDQMIVLLTSETKKALEEGYSALRVTGEMSWALRGLPGSERLIEYETKLNTFFPENRCLAICQYDQRRFSAEILLDILLTHPFAVIGTELYDNFYFTPPAELLKDTRSEMKLDRWISNLVDHKEVSQQLSESEIRYRELFSHLSSGVAIYEAIDDGEDFIFRDFNFAAEKIENLSRNDIIGKRVTEVFPMVKEFGLFEVFQRVYRSGRPEQLPASYYTDNRISGWRENFVYKLPSGTIVVIYDDVTERKVAEDALRESEEKYREFFTTSRDCVFITSPGGQWIDFNDVALEMFGFTSREELKKVPISHLYENPSERTAFLNLIIQRGFVKEFPVQLRRKDGTAIDTLITTVVIKNPDGSPRSFVGTVRDITGRKRAEDALRQSEDRYRTLAEASPDQIFIVGRDDTMKYANPAALKLFRLPYDQVIGTPRKNLFPPDIADAQGILLKKVFETGEIARKEELIQFGKQKIWIDTNLVPLKDEAGTVTSVLGIARDITERKVSEEEISNLQAFQESVIANANVWITVLDPKGTILVWNDAAESITGYKRGDVLGKRTVWRDLYPDKEYRDKVTSEIIRIIGQDSYLENFETEIRCADKTQKAIVWNTRGIRDRTGTIQSFIAIGQDITEQRRAEEALWDSREHYRAIIDYSQIAIAVLDTNYKIIMVNPRFSKLFNKPVEDFVGKYCFNEFEKRSAVCVHCPGTRSMVSGKPEEVETEGVRDDGSRFFVHNRTVPFFGPDGKVKGFVEMVEDITDRKKAELSIHESEQRYRTLIDSAAEGILVFDNETHKFRHTNPAMCSMLGYSEEELITLGIEDITPKESLDYVMGEFMAQIRGEKTLSMNIPLLRKDKTILYTDIRSARIFIDGKMSDVGFFTDITERKKAEDLLKRFNEELEQKVSARTKELKVSLDEKILLLREVHHRVNNNLQILISLMNLQSRTVTDPKVIEALTESTQRIRAMSMVHEKLYSGSDLAHIDFVSYLSSLAKSQVAFYQIDPRKVTLETTREPIMLDITTAIPLGLVMNELVSNALRHAFPGDRKGTIRIDARETAGQLEISIADDGVGVPEGFDYTNSPSLGLRLVNILTEQLSGTITLDRAEAGTAYHIIIPKKER